MTALAVLAAAALAYALVSRRLEGSVISAPTDAREDAARRAGHGRHGLHASSVLFMGWFGPRGLASIILVLVVADEVPELPGLGSIVATVTMTVLASVVLHGLSAPPLSRAYARGVQRMDADAPELV